MTAPIGMGGAGAQSRGGSREAPAPAHLTAENVAAAPTRLLVYAHRQAAANRDATGYRGDQPLITAIGAELRRRGEWR